MFEYTARNLAYKSALNAEFLGRALDNYRYNYQNGTCFNTYKNVTVGNMTSPACTRLMYQDVGDGSAAKGSASMGGIFAGGILLCVIACICICCCKRYKKTTVTKTKETTVIQQNQPGMMPMQPMGQPGMMPMQPGMQPGMMQPGMQPGMMPPMQPGMPPMQPGMMPPPPPPPMQMQQDWKDGPSGFQNDGAGQLWCAIANTEWGQIPGKSKDGECWFPYGGQEHSTRDFKQIERFYVVEHNNGPDGPPAGFQNDGAGQLWCAIADTEWGWIPGKAKDGECWFPYGGQEHCTRQFKYVIVQ